MKLNKPGYFSFLLRIWQEKSEGQLTWRVSLENPRNGERLGFSNFDELLDFLVEITLSGTSVNETISAHKLEDN